MKQIAILIACSIFLGTTSYSMASDDKKPQAQQDSSYSTKGRNIFIEFGGPSTLLSINFDTRFNETRNGWGGRIGAGYLPDGPQQHKFALPVQLNYLFGKEKHFFEAGAGATYFYTNLEGSYWDIDSNQGSSVFASFSAGYRYQPIIKGITFRIGATALAGSFFPGIIPHVSLGYAF